MDPSYLVEIASLSLRWLHLIVGIAWIGSSFYFIWLDNSIRPPADPELKERGVLGELWAMHAGGFYNPQKYVVAPKTLPDKVHWFFWPSYTTFISGFLLLTALYYTQPATYMIDPAKADLEPIVAVTIGFVTLVAGWLVYDLLCHLLINRSQMLFAVIYTTFVALVSFTLNQYLSGRAAFLHVGAMMATSMTCNVFFIIIPGQGEITRAMKRGEPPDPKIGKAAKQRSIHNNYLTLPVLFSMISNHYAFTYSHKHSWAVLILIFIGAAIIRHYFNLRHKEVYRLRYPIIGAGIIAGTFIWIAPPAKGTLMNVPNPLGREVRYDEVRGIFDARCVVCHAERPTLVASAPLGVMLDTPERLKAQLPRVYRQVVQLRAMPQGNITKITEDERNLIAAFIASGAIMEPTPPKPTTEPATAPTTAP